MPKKKDEKPSVDLAPSLEKLLAGKAVAAIRKDHGDSIFLRASEHKSDIPRIPTSIFRFDYALGGGFPVGRVSVSWGHKSSAKTTTYLKALANAQKMCANCWKFHPCECGGYRDPVIAFLDVEGTLDLKWAKTLGVDLERMLYSKPEYAEQTLDIAEAVIRNGADILVIDSLAFMAPAQEIMKSTAEDTVGLQARQIGKGTRKFVAAVNTVSNARGIGPTLFFTNQVRMKVGVMFGSPETQPGGLSTGFASSVEVKMRGGKYEMDDVLGKPLTGEFFFRVEKNKSGTPKMEGDFKLVLMSTDNRQVGDAVNEAFMVDMAQKIGLVEGGGSSWRALGEKFPSKTKISDRLVEDEEFYGRLHNALMNILLSED
jgi:recombination protein RecA